VIASTRPCAAVWSSNQRLHLGAAKETDELLFKPLVWDRHDPSCHSQTTRVVEGHEAKEASKGCEPGVARTDAAATVAFDMVQEREDGIGIDLGNGKGRRRDPGRILHKLQQEAEGVSVRSHCSRAGMFVHSQVLSEESKVRTNKSDRCTHPSPPAERSSVKRAPAALRRSGVAERYQ
jgi:hypothetical protein